MLVCVFLCAIAHETAGAARTRSSLRPLMREGGMFKVKLARNARRDREVMVSTIYAPCRPGLEPGPIRRGPSSRALALDTFCKMSAAGYGSRLKAGTTSNSNHLMRRGPQFRRCVLATIRGRFSG